MLSHGRHALKDPFRTLNVSKGSFRALTTSRRAGRAAIGQAGTRAFRDPCPERRVQDIAGALKGAFETLSVLNAPFGTPPVSRKRLSGQSGGGVAGRAGGGGWSW